MRAIAVICLLAALVAGLPGRASARRPDWKAANAIYLKAKATNHTPRNRMETLLCASYWAAWANAADTGKIPKKARPYLDLDLATLNAQLHAARWALKLDDDAYDTYRELQDSSSAVIALSLSGDPEPMAGLMGVLGSCQAPKQ